MAQLAKFNLAWIGGVQFRDWTWGWTDGSKWGTVNKFRTGQPDNYKGVQNSLLINFGLPSEKGLGLWDDMENSAKLPYVCQYLDLAKLDKCK